MKELKGAFTALVTPMKENGDVDYDGFRRLINFQLEQGIDGLLPLGTTGETSTLTGDEAEKLIRIAVDEVRKNAGSDFPLMIGTGSNDTRCMLEYTKRAKDMGADFAMVVTPYYNKPNDDGLLRHFEAAASVGIPIVVYNIAGRTARNIPTALLEKIAVIPGIIGVKESSGDITQMSEVLEKIARKRPDFKVLAGDDGFILPLMAMGGNGAISVIANLVPARIKALVKTCLEGNFEEARNIHFELTPLIRTAFIETNPVPIKQAMTWAGLPGGPCRLPLGKLDPKNEEPVRAVLKKLGL